MKGIGASPGIAIGRALLKKDPKIRFERKQIKEPEEELKRLEHAIALSIRQLDQLRQHTLENIGKEEARIFEAQLMLLEDPNLFGQVKEKVKTEGTNAEWNIKIVVDEFLQCFKSMDNSYLKERAADLKDVTLRVIKVLLGLRGNDLSKLENPVIIIAEDLTPSDTAQMDKEKVLGFITEIGGGTSHSAIMARTLEIPAVVGVEAVTKEIKTGDLVILDGSEGKVIVDPDEELVSRYQLKRDQVEKNQAKLNLFKDLKSSTKDGFEVEIAGNIGDPKDVKAVIANGGEGIGLFRTEFLYMDRDELPTEEEQFLAYKEVAEKMAGKPVVIRTLDVGGDKGLSYLELSPGINPSLGYRAIRLCLDRIDIFKSQLRALLRASAFGNLKIMFPIISSLDELRAAKDLVERCKEELSAEKVEFNQNLEIGIMIEVPAAALISDFLAKETDFFSIGTNDLIQYTVAADRMNPKVSHLYNHFHPGLLRLIKQVIDNGHKAGIWVGMCGEAAGDLKFIPLLLGMRLDEFSMNPGQILKARQLINKLSQHEMGQLVEEVLGLATAREVENFLCRCGF